MNFNPVKTKILVVEDEAVQRRILRLQLEKQGYEVHEAEDGRQGLDLCLANPQIRLVVTDLMMPNVDGFDLIKAIRGQETNYTYIIVLTAREDKESVVRSLSLGADDFITKPFFPDELNLRLGGAMRLLKLESHEELVFSLAKLAAYRSGETGSHLHRVREFCLLLALDLHEHHPEFGLTRTVAEEIAKMAPLHDIGKVGVPDSILHKPGRLSREEFELMRGHVRLGGDLLREIYEETGAPFLLLAHEIAMYHHERWDGSGYPDGLAGERIPLPARIMALADVVDALISKRCYKDALSFVETRAIILAERGRHFDPRLVDAFFRQEKQWQAVVEKYGNDLGASREVGVAAKGKI
ncbi:HD-GYP domain-containing protein [Thiovibrio sp. JS02]